MTGRNLNTAHLWVHAMFNLVIFGVERYVEEMGCVTARRDYQNSRKDEDSVLGDMRPQKGKGKQLRRIWANRNWELACRCCRLNVGDT